MPAFSIIKSKTIATLLILLGNVSSSLGAEFVEFREPTLISFPSGYDIVDDQGKILKSLPDSRAAMIRAYKQLNRNKLYVSDWSWKRYQNEKKEPNYIRSRGENLESNPEDAKELERQFKELTNHARRVIAEGDFENGFRLLSESYELITTTFGADSLEAGHALYQAADLMKDKGLYDVAELPYISALRIYIKNLGRDAIETATLRNNIGSLYENLGRFDEAKTAYLESKESLIKTAGEKSLDVGIVYANLAGVYEKQGQFAAEEVALLRALDLLLSHRGTNDTQVLQLRGRLSALYAKFADDGAPQNIQAAKQPNAIDVAKAVFPSTYWIECYDSEGAAIATGSGFQVHKELIVTNHHVVEGAQRITIKNLGSSRALEVKFIQHIDTENDLVVLNVPASNVSALKIEPSVNLPIGSDVFAIGNPMGLEGSISQGIVSGFREAGTINLIQTTAPISPGNSGGPLVDSFGKVRGIIVASLRNGQNLNFAVPSEALIKLLESAPQQIPPRKIPKKSD